MQWNYPSPFLQNLGYDPFSFSKAPSYPQIIGEGDVTSVILPDGTIQLFFVPTNRHFTLSPFQMNTNFPTHCSANKDIWFVRSICHPLPPNLLNRQFPNVYGDQQPPPQCTPNFCINSPPSTDYYQKFHNDDSTSTTDIHYFYPSLRCNGNLKYSAEVQTEPFEINCNSLDGCQDHCGYRNAEAVVKKNFNINDNASASSTSYMSVDSVSKSKHRLNKRNKKSKTNKSRYSLCECHQESKKSKYKTNKNSDLYCECHLETKKSKYKTNKSRDNICECHLEPKKSKYRTNKSRDNLCECHLETKKSKYRTNKSRDNLCECHLETKKSKCKTNKSRDPYCECNLENKNSTYKSGDSDLETKKHKLKTNKSRDNLCECHLETKESKCKTNKSRDPYCKCNLENKNSTYKSGDSDLETKKHKLKTNKSRDNLCECPLETKESKCKTNKSRDPYCECNLEGNNTSDKLISTYAEKASGGIIKDGRQTQTTNKKSKRSDIKTEIWQPIHCKSSSMLELLSCDDCSDRCCCRSTSETE